jgi:hypothetical protein
MSLITRMRKQKAVYWARNGVDAEGRPTYAAPAEIACRWEDTQEDFVTADGKTLRSTAVVYPENIARDGDLYSLGTVAGTNADPFQVPGALEVRRFARIPNLKAKEFLHVAHLGGRAQ